MMTHRSTLLGLALPVAAMLLMPVAAQAADLSPRGPVYKAVPGPAYSPFEWTGFYFGINGGGGFGTSRHNFALTTTGDYRVSGGLIGGTIGHNWQTGSYVFGAEGDLGWSNIKGSAPCPNPVFTCGSELSWLATGRGRLGFVFDRWLPYATAGGALGDVKATVTGPVNFPGVTATRLGWTVGGGLEYAAWTYWSLKAEYLYVDLGSFNCGAQCGAAVDNVSFKTHIIRAGLNYRF